LKPLLCKGFVVFRPLQTYSQFGPEHPFLGPEVTLWAGNGPEQSAYSYYTVTWIQTLMPTTWHLYHERKQKS
jgi:hypothetical protein